MDTAVHDPDGVARRTAEVMVAADAAARGAGVRLLDVGAGRARVALTVEARNVNGHGICHGGDPPGPTAGQTGGTKAGRIVGSGSS